MRLRFADCVLDTDARQVFRGGTGVHLSSKAYELLRVLADARPRALSKDELYAHLWADTFVIEANLANLIAEIRAALGDEAHKPHIIRTVHGFGYAFCGEAALLPARPDTPASCCLVWNERRFALTLGDNLIGREPDARVSVDLPSVSRRHAIVTVTTDNSVIVDLGSKNGTLVRGRRIDEPTPLLDGDEVQIGSVIMTFRTWSAEQSTETINVD
jgi:DNA-binding winged helix-turn-helix (wHTH) protein